MNRGSIYFKNPWQQKSKPLYEREEPSSFSFLMSEAVSGMADFHLQGEQESTAQHNKEPVDEGLKFIRNFSWLIDLGEAQSYFVGLVLTTIGQEDSPIGDHFIPLLSGNESMLIHSFSDEGCLRKFCTRKGRLEVLLNCQPITVNLEKDTTGFKISLNAEQFDEILIEIYKQTGSAYLDVIKRENHRFPYVLTHNPHFSLIKDGPQFVYPYAFCYRSLVHRSPVDKRWAALKTAQNNLQLH